MCRTSTVKYGHFLVRTTRSALFRHIPEAVRDLPGSPLHLYLLSKLPKKIYVRCGRYKNLFLEERILLTTICILAVDKNYHQDAPLFITVMELRLHILKDLDEIYKNIIF